MGVLIFRRGLAISVALLTVGLAGACGKDQAPGIATVGGVAGAPAASSSPAADRQEAMRQFAQCMRDNGVDFPDPQPGQGFGGAGAGFNRNDPKLQAAFTACRSKLPNGGQPPKLNQQQLEQYRKFAECMRSNGVDVPDPNPDGTLQLRRGGANGSSGGPNFGDPAFRAAAEKCRPLLAGVFPSRGPGGGSGGGTGGGQG